MENRIKSLGEFFGAFSFDESQNLKAFITFVCYMLNFFFYSFF